MLRLLHGSLLAAFLSLCGMAHAQTLAAVRAAHQLTCGTVQGADDWNGEDIHGNLSALGAEICRAVAVAILGTEDGLTIPVFPAEPEALVDRV
jgi:general L-amino acid transport system substrate-binding protein